MGAIPERDFLALLIEYSIDLGKGVNCSTQKEFTVDG